LLHDLVTAVDAELGVEVAHVGANGVHRQEEMVSDFGHG